MRILVITPFLAVPPRGACEHDRMVGIQQLIRLGHDVRVFSFLAAHQTPTFEQEATTYLGRPVQCVNYQPLRPTSVRAVWHRLVAAGRHPALLDGAALPHAQLDVIEAFDTTLARWTPDVAWFDYTNMWPLLERAKMRGVATVMRSLNYEPRHNLDERGRNLANGLRYFGKYLSERTSIQHANAFAAITPADRNQYLKLGRTDCIMLPLRSLPSLLQPPRRPRVRSCLEVFFFGSNYDVSHNRTALLFILKNIVPKVRRAKPGGFRFHLLGAKAPSDLDGLQSEDVRMQGFVPDLDTFLEDMDIALIPSLHGGGMQQKLFEPLCRAFPLVASPRGLAGFSVRDGAHALFANESTEFVKALLRLREPALRAKLSAGANRFAEEHFNATVLDSTVEKLLSGAVNS